MTVEVEGRTGVANMQIDEALLDEVVQFGGAYLRLYCWNPPTLSIGRNQSLDGLVRDGIPWVRRPTGGQAVWHEHEVTYAVAAPVIMFGSLRSAYREIHQRLAGALRSIGVDAVLADPPAVRPSRRAQPVCFAFPAGGEILVAGRKLVGSAQVRKRRAFLQHGSILLDGHQPRVGSSSQETTLARILGRPVSFGEVAEAIVAAWQAPFRPIGRPAVRPSDVIASLAAP